MLKAGFGQALRTNRKQQLPQGSRTPVKDRSPIARSPIKSRRDCSPLLKSPLRKQTYKLPSPAYNLSYLKMDYGKHMTPTKQLTPLKELQDKYTTNTQQPYKFRQQQLPKYSPFKIHRADENQFPLERKNSGKYTKERDSKPNNYQLFGKLAKENRKEPTINYNEATNSQRRHPLLTKLQEVKFISANNFNSDPHLSKLNRYKENPLKLLQMKKPTEKLLKRHLSDQEAQKNKPHIKESIANLDRVLMSFDRQHEDCNDTYLNMDPFL